MKSLVGYFLLAFGLICLFKGFENGYSLSYMIGAAFLFVFGVNLLMAVNREKTIAAVRDEIEAELDQQDDAEGDLFDDTDSYSEGDSLSASYKTQKKDDETIEF